MMAMVGVQGSRVCVGEGKGQRELTGVVYIKRGRELGQDVGGLRVLGGWAWKGGSYKVGFGVRGLVGFGF